MYNITYRTKKLEKCRKFSKVAVKTWNETVAFKYHKCINILEAIENLNDLQKFTFLKFHALTGERKNQYALKLDKRWRLIFTLQGSKQNIIRIEEVSRHYGD